MGKTSEALAQFDRIKAGLFSGAPTDYFECLSLFFALLSQMSKRGTYELQDNKIQSEKAYAALQMISEKYSNKISIKEIASALSVTPEYLAAIFQKTFGISPKTQIQNFRLQHAGELLWASNLSVKEVAFAVGYNSLNTFDRAFRRFHSAAPTQYREKLLNETKSGPKIKYHAHG